MNSQTRTGQRRYAVNPHSTEARMHSPRMMFDVSPRASWVAQARSAAPRAAAPRPASLPSLPVDAAPRRPARQRSQAFEQTKTAVLLTIGIMFGTTIGTLAGMALVG